MERAEAPNEPRPRDADEALERLLAGNRRFAADAQTRAGRDSARRAELAHGQQPFAIILGCSDSRVPAEVVFDQGLGDLFVVRVAGNTVLAPAVIGSIEFAAQTFGSVLVMVLGHEACGAVAGAVGAVTAGAEAEGSIGDVIEPIVPVVKRVTEAEPDLPERELVERCVRENVRQSIDQLLERSPLLARLADAGELRIVGAEYGLASGEVVLVSGQ